MFSKLFKNKAPSTHQVDTQLTKLSEQEAAHNSRSQAIDALLIEAWGDPDIDATTLKNEQREISDELQRLVSVRAALMAQRRAAAIRETAAEYERRLSALAQLGDTIPTLKADTEAKRTAFHAAADSEQRARSKFSLDHVALADWHNAAANGNPDVRAALADVRARHQLRDIAESNAQARALAQAYPKTQEQS